MRRVLWLIFMLISIANADDKKTNDSIFVNGKIYAGGANAGSASRPTAIAVRDGRVISIGSDAEIRKMAGPSASVIDLHGQFVMPGFNDAHAHLATGGFEKMNVNLIGSTSLAEMQSRIAERVKKAAPGEWIVGRGWDHTKWPGRTLPTRQDIDKVTGDHPAMFGRVDGHIAVANSAALRSAGITKQTASPSGAAIDHDSSGEPTGILREDAAMALVRDKVPPASPAQHRKAMELALEDAARSGITSAQDNSDWEDYLALEQIQREGKLTLRVSEWLPFGQSVENLKKMRDHHPHGDHMLHSTMLKGYMDGSLGSRTAALLAPYSDDPKNSGLPRFSQEQLNQMVRERAAEGFQIGFHAIGDRGVEMALDAFEQAVSSKQPNDLRFRIEHDQVVQPDQVPRYKKLGVIASVQPNHLLTDMNWAEERIGKERAKSSYPWASFLNGGVPLAFGTDYPVEPIAPFRGLYAAVTRKNEAGTGEYYPEQKLSIEQAIAAYTTGSAYAEFAEKEKGTLAPGMLADFVVLDRDITAIPAHEILKTEVLRTVVGGKTVYEAK
ncbi:MAG: Amidohydrolase 3 [Candidatus Angelobacter sp.]|jgi:predicted amidohydrolase YtcJ|nr:Amidohydrolase 3 [Candidatus Angelobacter sp.]